MTRRSRAPQLAAVLLATVLGAACEAREPRSESTAGIRLIDAAGRELALPGPARRIVSLVPSATQTLAVLGHRDRLVGRTDFDQETWLTDVPSVGGGLEPNLEAIVALRPDLVIRFAGEQDARTPARLDELGIAHAAIRPDRIADVYAAVELLGAVTGSAARADSVVVAIRAQLAAVEARVADLPRQRVVYVLGGTPPWVAGPGTYVNEVVELVGGTNVFADLSALYTAVSPEELRIRDIDVVLVSDLGQFDASLAPGARIVAVGDALELPGPHVADAAWHVAELLHDSRLR